MKSKKAKYHYVWTYNFFYLKGILVFGLGFGFFYIIYSLVTNNWIEWIGMFGSLFIAMSIISLILFSMKTKRIRVYEKARK